MMHPDREEESLDLQELHEINVTPFIDVMLVLLIVFMIAAPLATVDLPVALPEAAVPAHQPPPEPIYLTLQRDLSLALGERRLRSEALADALAAASGGDPTAQIFVGADHRVSYGALMALLDTLRAAGYSQLALVAAERTTSANAESPAAQ